MKLYEVLIDPDFYGLKELLYDEFNKKGYDVIIDIIIDGNTLDVSVRDDMHLAKCYFSLINVLMLDHDYVVNEMLKCYECTGQVICYE